MESTEEVVTGSKHSASDSNEGSVMTKENTLFLISLVKSYGCLWNQADSGYTNESDKQNAWKNISKMMGYPVKEVKDKWDNVSSCFYMFHSKSLGNVIQRKWFAYDALRFLDVKPHDKPPYNTQPNDSFKLRWNDEIKLYFISLVKRNECLWNNTCPDYKDALSKKNAWKAISEAMECSEDDLKWKWTNLRASFHKYHSNVETSSGNERSSKYAAAKKWYAYEALSFLANQPDEDEPLDPALMADESIATLPKNDSLKEDSDSEIVTLVNIRDNTVVCKSIDELTAKPLQTSPSTRPRPQTQVGNALRIDRRSQPWMKTPVRVKRPYPMPVEDPLQIKQTPPTQHVQVGAPFQNVQRRSLGGRPTLNPSSVKSFVNLIEQELSEISSDFATMAQVDIYKIIGEYKLKDVRRSSEASFKPMNTKIVKQVVEKRIEPKPVKIAPSYSLGNNDVLAVALECEEDAS